MPSLNRLVVLAATFGLALAAGPAPSQAQWWNLFDRDRQNVAPPPNSQDAPQPITPQPIAPSQAQQPPAALPGGGVAQEQPQPSFGDDPAGQMERLQAQIRMLTGQVEQLTHQVDELQAIVQTQQEDNEYRFQALEGGGPAVDPESRSELELPMDGGGEVPMDAGGEHDQAGLAGPGEPPRILGTLTLADPGAASGQTEAMPGDPNAPLDLSRLARPDGAPAAGGAPQPGSELASLPPPATADAAYDRAYTQLVSGDYDLAEAGFRQFVANYPDNELAPDARYWLGETFFARGDYRNAADTFLSSYRTHPSGRKAPDTLLKLGLSLDALGERKAACATYAELLAKHQSASNALIQRVKAEQARAEC